jgi:hypothetical protein
MTSEYLRGSPGPGGVTPICAIAATAPGGIADALEGAPVLAFDDATFVGAAIFAGGSLGLLTAHEVKIKPFARAKTSGLKQFFIDGIAGFHK